MYIIGITGGIGSGKSTAARILRQRGIPVLDADALSHTVSGSGGRAIPALIEEFGPDILNETGGMDRAQIASRVFAHRSELDRLSRIIHRFVFEEMNQQIQELQKNRVPVVCLDVPIPVKEGFLDRCHLILVIQAPEELRLMRLQQRGMEREEARQRMRMQFEPEVYAQLADHIVENLGTEAELAEKLDHLLQPLLKARGIPYGVDTQEEL